MLSALASYRLNKAEHNIHSEVAWLYEPKLKAANEPFQMNKIYYAAAKAHAEFHKYVGGVSV